MAYTWIRGTTFTMALRVTSGTVTGSETIRCVMKASDLKTPDDDDPEAVVFSTSYVAAAGDEPAHWLITATADQGAALEVGAYQAAARLVIGSTVIQTTPVTINVVERLAEAS